MDVAGDYAYIADWNSGLVVMDVSNPENPSTVATLPTTGSSLGINVYGSHVYIGNGSSLMIVDISDPLNPIQVSTLLTPGAAARGLTVEGHYAYVADGNAGIQIIDIADPASPVIISTFDTPGYAYDVVTAGAYAYVSDQSNGMVVVNISDPANPFQVGHYSSTGNTRGLFYSGQYIYLAHDTTGLDVINVTDPSLPVLENNLDTTGNVYDVCIHGTSALVADLGGGVKVVKVAETAGLGIVNTINTINYSGSMFTVGKYLFMNGGPNGLTTYDLTNPENPVHVGGGDTGWNGNAVFGNYFIGFSYSGMAIVDLSQPSAPVQVASLGGFGSNAKASIWGTKAVVLDDHDLVVVDLSNPLQPAEVNRLAVGNGSLDVWVEGNYAYIADQYDGFVVVDISAPGNLQVVSSFDVPFATTMSISGNRAYIGSGASLVVLDISDPLSPAEIGQYTANYPVTEVKVIGNRAFLRKRDGGLEVLDISNPALPVQVSEYTFGLYVFPSIAVHGDFVYSNVYPRNGHPGPRELLVFQTSQHAVNIQNNVGVSANVDQDDALILQANVGDVYSGNNLEKFELSADGGAHWEEIPKYTDSIQFANPGTNLRWRMTLDWRLNVNGINDLQLDWFGPAAPLASIQDVPDDQGGRVIVDLKRSAYDHNSEMENPVTQYGVYRRLVDVNKAIDFESARKLTKPEEVANLFPGYDSAWLDGDFIVAGAGDKSGFPTGNWVLVATIPALQSNHYFAEVSTLADSNSVGTNSSEFVVTTHTITPSIWYTSNIMSGYSVDNIAPGVPSAIMALYQSEGVELSWDDSLESDFQFFRIYRGNQPGFVPTEENLLIETANSFCSDETSGPWEYIYQVSAVDHAGNESLTGDVEGVSDAPEAQVRDIFDLQDAVPNPFNPMTTIEYSLPSDSQVQLKIYDMAGREVFTLVDDVQAAGVHKAQWTGRNNSGGKVASGIYLYRLKAGSNEEWKRMTLLK